MWPPTVSAIAPRPGLDRGAEADAGISAFQRDIPAGGDDRRREGQGVLGRDIDRPAVGGNLPRDLKPARRVRQREAAGLPRRRSGGEAVDRADRVGGVVQHDLPADRPGQHGGDERPRLDHRAGRKKVEPAADGQAAAAGADPGRALQIRGQVAADAADQVEPRRGAAGLQKGVLRYRQFDGQHRRAEAQRFAGGAGRPAGRQLHIGGVDRAGRGRNGDVPGAFEPDEPAAGVPARVQCGARSQVQGLAAHLERAAELAGIGAGGVERAGHPHRPVIAMDGVIEAQTVAMADGRNGGRVAAVEV
jgi:hypothetical protein